MNQINIDPSCLWCPVHGELENSKHPLEPRNLRPLDPCSVAGCHEKLALVPWNLQNLPLLLIPLPLELNPFRPPRNVQVLTAYSEPQEHIMQLALDGAYYMATDAQLVLFNHIELPPAREGSHQGDILQMFRPINLSNFDGIQGNDYLLPLTSGVVFLHPPWDQMLTHDLRMKQYQLWQNHQDVEARIKAAEEAQKQVVGVQRPGLVTAASIPSNLKPFPARGPLR